MMASEPTDDPIILTLTSETTQPTITPGPTPRQRTMANSESPEPPEDVEPFWIKHALDNEPVYAKFLGDICLLERHEAASFIEGTTLEHYECIFALQARSWTDWYTILGENDYKQFIPTICHMQAYVSTLELLQVELRFVKVKSADNLADFLTKPLAREPFLHLVMQVLFRKPPSFSQDADNEHINIIPF